ncbi:glycosyltransferase [Patescibacteria group bacterium]
MNIAIFTNNYLPNPYGVTTSIESFRGQFEEKGHRVYIFAPQSSDWIDQNPNVFRYPSVDFNFKIKFPLPIPYSAEIDSVIDGLELDIIHSQHPNLLGSVAKRWAKKKKIPLVFTWHTLYDQYTNYIPFVPSGITAKWAIDNAVEYANSCDAVVVPTNSIKPAIEKWGVENKEIATIPTGVDTTFFEGEKRGDEIRESLGLSSDDIVLLTVSRLAEEKNVEFLLESTIEAMKQNEKLKFVIGGEGYLDEELKKVVKKNALEERIFFTGLIKKDKLKDYFDAADVFVYSSKSETQGTIITEVMHSGLPIVALDSLGVCDLIRDGGNGFLVKDSKDDFSSAILKLVDDFKLREEFGKKSSEIAKSNYTDDVCSDKMLRLYEKVIEEKNNI